MKQEIIEYVKKNPEVDAVDIADDLLLDAFKVNDILVELIKEGNTRQGLKKYDNKLPNRR